MWCFISEPNGIIHEIFLPKNAVGQECLDKVRNYNSAILNMQWIFPRHLYADDSTSLTFELLVFVALFGTYFMVLQPLQVCEKLKLVEKDYFGLKFGGAKRAKFWLNLRNSMSSQLTGKPPYRLYFLVKFFVKPQELQQEITRWVKQVKFLCMFCILSIVPAEWAALKYTQFTRIVFVIVFILFNRRFTFMCISRCIFFSFQAPVLSDIEELYKRREARIIICAN